MKHTYLTEKNDRHRVSSVTHVWETAPFLTHSTYFILKEVAMTENFREMPIILGINPFTNRIDGDDTGYRRVEVSPLDTIDSDPLVFLYDHEILELPVYHRGATSLICPYYPNGIGGYSNILVREPVLKGLVEADSILHTYNRKLLVLDGFRHGYVQQKLWKYLFRLALRKSRLEIGTLTITQLVSLGMEADAIGSYCDVVRDEAFQAQHNVLLNGKYAVEFNTVAKKLTMDVRDVVDLYLCFCTNLEPNGLTLNFNAPTAHGSGGAIDLWLIDLETDLPCFFGAPFDYMAPSHVSISPVVLDYFDRPDVTVDTYYEALEADMVLRDHVFMHGFSGRVENAFRVAQRERRVLAHTMEALGGTFYNGEFFHYQLGNERGGKQKGYLLGSGNACHAILTGKQEAVWGNSAAHNLAREIMLR